jgi:hypothetical protein
MLFYPEVSTRGKHRDEPRTFLALDELLEANAVLTERLPEFDVGLSVDSGDSRSGIAV